MRNLTSQLQMFLRQITQKYVFGPLAGENKCINVCIRGLISRAWSSSRLEIGARGRFRSARGQAVTGPLEPQMAHSARLEKKGRVSSS